MNILASSILVLFLIFLSLYYLIFIKKKKKKEFIFDEKEEKLRAQNYPHPYPDGWFNLCESKDIKAGEVKEISAFGQKLALFRGENGKVGVLDVYCPHLNANLAKGKVVGNHLVCPFHAWEFDALGQCQKIPYNDTIPKQACLKSWIIKEQWGLILIWYHAAGKQPTWTTDSYLPEYQSYRYHGMTSELLHIHLQDFAENGADYAHFAVVHNLLTIPFANHFVYVRHTTNIEFGEGENSHIAEFSDIADLIRKKDNTKIEKAGGRATVTYFGPGFLVFKFYTKIGSALLIKTFTPIGELKVRMDDYVYAPKGTCFLALKYILSEAKAQFIDDIEIWENKNFAKKPVLVKNDGPIMKMRAWYSQFYSNQKKEELLID